MNEKLQYASMLEIPVNTCNITYKPAKKVRRRRKKEIRPEEVKEQLLQKVNAENIVSKQTIEDVKSENVAERENLDIENQSYVNALNCDDMQTPEPINQADMQQNGQGVDGEYYVQGDGENAEIPKSDYIEDLYQPTSNVRRAKIENKKKKGRFKISVLGVQLAIIGVLIATIFITNALYTDSGVNVFLRGVFGTESSQVDNRSYTDFAPVINDSDLTDYQMEEGVLTFSGTGSIYPSANGTITSVTVDDNGKYTVEIAHNKNFISVFSGLDYAYSSAGDKVYATLPVGFVKEQATMCFMGADGKVISNYQIIDDTVVWAV